MNENNVSVMYLHALTPVHAGTGQVSASVIDLPVAREKATGWPVLPATSIKGVLRAETPEADRAARFGDKDASGSLQFGDARLVCFPVRSWRGVFAYVTCPLALNRLRRDLQALGAPVPFTQELKDLALTTVLIADTSVLAENNIVYLEDLELQAPANANVASVVAAIADGIARAALPESERDGFKKRFLIASDDVFDFLAENATEVSARIKLQEGTKNTEGGGLWYEESVPAEAIFAAPVRGGAVPVASGAVIQIGGNENVGRGLCRVTVARHE